ncbi:proteoglycan-like sulfated glycoprotein papilin isoform X2 [Dermacentor variabilis]|uniref:proteoglycan-like sulfated glycoprotein papilin isoform X2 n=1 Tax=Dermacentor variabilis TaxID=34621 RepID=UPI003F5B32D9
MRSWGAVLLAAFLLLLDSPADGRRHLIRHGRQRRQHQHLHHFQQNVTLGLKPGSYQESGPWGPWTASSSCSRTCGGGVAYQTRVCEDFRHDGSHGCTGPSRKYFSCNVEECPDHTKDFREEQCARFNSIPFEGRYYSWVPYYKAANPCELNCKPKGERFYYRHSAKTIDGTRCHDDGSLDVCVDGACMPVGCDKMLGSDAVEDKCRVCRGDGTSCSTVEGVFDLDNLQVGYNDILLIPSGATNIRIEEKFPTNNYLAVRNQTGYYYLNGNWRIEFPRSIRFAGTVFHYERRNHGANAPESLVALGPTIETILIVLLYQEKNLGITYEYSVPHTVSRQQPDMYNWNSGDFGECSQTCGGGAQTRLVYCTSATTFEKVSDDLCNPTVKPQATRVCNPEPCPATWYVGEWEDCSKSCGNGTQLRLVFCQRRTEAGSVLTADSDCESSGPKPERLQDCSSDAECASWEVGNWTECDRLCGEGTQIREVVCINPLGGETVEVLDDSGCDESKKPPSNQTCELRPCDGTEWVTSPWSGCELPCSSRIETRQVLCTNEEGVMFPDEYCDDEKRPNTTKPCDEDDSALDEQCQYMWYYSQWSPCSTECGNGMQTRKVFCGSFIDGNIVNVTDDNCNPAEQLNSTRECTVEAVCNGTWVAAPWNQCSTPCGGGQRTRTIICHVNGKPAAPKNCDVSKKPFDTESCNMNACDEDEVILLGGCKDSKHGCCPDGMTPAGPSFAGCPKVTPVEGGCKATEFGCCLDGVTAAFGPFRKGCQQLSLCNGTEFGCCPDGETPAEGPNNEGCLLATTDAALFANCSTAKWGCCPDGITAAEDANKTNCIEVSKATFIPCADSQFGCCPDNMTAADGPSGLNCIEGSGTEEPCHGTTHGCCPDGWSVAQGPNNEGCPPYFPVTPVPTCSLSTHGCCADGMTAAAGPDGLGCEDEVEGSGTEPTDCENTLFGCCPDGKTPASGAGFEGCSDCSNTTFGCCPDGVSTATGEAFEGCAEGCEDTKYGCCQDKISPAEGPDFEGCENCTESLYGCCEDNVTFALGPDGEGCCVVTEFGCCRDNVTAATADGCICNMTVHGCCPDNVTVALGPDFEGCTCEHHAFGCCPDKKSPAEGPDFEGCVICTNTTFGCCPDDVTAALGPNFEGCEGYETNCTNTTFGCCPDGVQAAEGENFAGCTVACESTQFGCCPDGLAPASGIGFEGCDNCSESLYGCCADNTSFVLGPDGEGCCFHTEFGCCLDNKTEAQGPDRAGCSCHTTPHGCCPDGIATASGPRYYGCTCRNYPFGCCQDKHTPAAGLDFEGCICSRLLYGCCPDDVTPAEGPDMAGCPCQITEFGCCLDQRTPARGPNLAGCGCETMPYGCCPDQRTPARGPGFGGCPCTAMPYGCCPDQHTAAQGPDGRGCECEKLLYGCCPDRVTPATGPSLTGCTCHHYPHGCCPDGQTPARGPEYDGCTCAMTAYGCCPDGVTAARGRNFEGCQDTTPVSTPNVSASVCGLPEERGPCHNYTVYWFFSVTDGRCNRFWYGGCEGNGNRFNSEEECKNTCVKPEGPDACLLPKVIGTCDGQYQHWYFDATTRSCESFMYGGCLGNNNRFASKDLCEQTCLHQEKLDPCEQSAAPGPCRGSYKRFYYDRQDNQCKRFTYGGCQGNANNFATEEECSEQCVRLSAQEICILAKEEGRCLSEDRKWYYDYVEGRCKEFVYTGCQGNRNRFNTRDQCERMCNSTRVAVSRDICALPKEEGPCRAAILHWHYNMAAGRCEQFYYGGCEGNANRFESRRDCERACLSIGSRNICLLPQEAGNCVEFRERWFYNAEEGRCHRFYYGGCDGNENNFASHLECEQTCGQPAPTEETEEEFRHEFCSMPSETGPCTNMEVRWFYDKQDGVCREFYYGGCLGNRNRFRSRRDCEDRCFSSQDLCMLPRVQGPCSGTFTQWFYDSETDRCHEFTYGGCQGNANRFNDREACENQCRKRVPVPTEQPTERPTPLDVCTLPKQPGPCYGLLTMWYFDTATRECRSFTYGGCEGNDNRFESRELCEQRCGRHGAGPAVEPPTRHPTKPRHVGKGICKKTVDPGDCREAHERWFYDAQTGVCLQFVYTGCGGNKNRFKSAEICMEFCFGVTKDTPEYEVSEPDLDDGKQMPPSSRKPEGSDEELDPRVKPPMAVTPFPAPFPLTPVAPPQTPAPECLPSNCEDLQCPLGKNQTVDHRGCVQCRCSNPCETFSCHEEELCRIEAYRSADGSANYRPVCRLVNKPGHCPVAEVEAQPAAVVRADCRDVCRVDADCPDVRKCCYNGCAHVCVQAVVTESTTSHVSTTTQTPILTPEPTNEDLSPPVHRPAEMAAHAKPEVTANAGSDVTLSCLDRPFLIVSVTWTFRDESVESNEGRFKILVDGSLHISQLTGDDAGPYRCTADDGRQKVSHVTNLVVFVPATIKPSSATVTVTVSSTARLLCLAVGHPTPIVQWYRHGKQLPQRSARYAILADFTLAIRNVTLEDEDIYMCRAYNYHGQPAVWKVSLSVLPLSREPAVPGRRRRRGHGSRGSSFRRTGRKIYLTGNEVVTVDVVIATSENRVGAPLQLDCYVTGSPEPRVSWLHDGKQVETDSHHVLMENHTLLIPSAAMSDGGEYSCQADNGHSNESVSVHIIMDDIYVPESCTDNPRFANCNLIVRARYCTNKHYSRFCCRSCMLAGQIHADGNGYTNGNGNGNGYGNGYGNGFSNGNGFGNGYINGYSNGNGHTNGYRNFTGTGNGNGKANELA